MNTLPIVLVLLGCCLRPPRLEAQIELPKPIQGSFRVDPRGQGAKVFTSLDTAVRYLGLVGISGDLEVVVMPGVYQGALRLFDIPGQQPGQKVVFRCAGAVRLESSSGILELLDGCHDLVFDGFTFGSSIASPAVMVHGACHDIEIRNCHFTDAIGGPRLVEIQGQNKARGIDIHHNRFELRHGARGIYTQGTTRLSVHHNDFRSRGGRELIGIWNSNKSESRIYDNVFRGEVSGHCLRLNVSGHDVDVYDNLFLVEMGSGVVIGSRGLRNRAWNRIHHNLFVLPGEGSVYHSQGPVAIDSNSYALEAGGFGRADGTPCSSLKEWQEELAGVAVDDQAEQGSAIAGAGFFERHGELLALFHGFGPDAEPAGTKTRQPRRAHLQYLIGLLKEDDVVVQRLAIRALRRLGAQASAAVPALGRICNHSHAPVRADAAAALGEIRVGAEIVIPELIKLLQDRSIRVVLPAIRTLRGFAHLARQAAPDLRRLQEHRDPAVQAAAKTALAAIDN